MRTTFFVSVLAILLLASGQAYGASCESVTTLNLPNVKVTAAAEVAPGAFVPPGAPPRGGGPGAAFSGLPTFCRVAATLTPSSDSDIKIEVWLPTSGWNGKLQAVGNGAWTGSIAYPAMAEGLRRGYATTSTDTGHVGGSASFGMGHPEKVTDFAYRSEHEMTVTAKAIINKFYGNAPKFSYWTGCSAGGRQAMKAAQMFPNDFDGIIAGSPGLDWSGRTAQAVRIAQALQKEEARITPAKAQVLHSAVVAACDALDGVKDGLIENPIACKFDPAVLVCKGGEEPACLTQAQADTAKLIYSPIVDAKTKREIPGLAPGSGPAPAALPSRQPGRGHQHQQSCVPAARHGTAGVDVGMNHFRKACSRIQLHHVVRVVVREQQRPLVAGDEAIGVVPLPLPDRLPRLPRGNDSRNRGRGFRRSRGTSRTR